MEPLKMTLMTTLGKLGDYWEVPFFGSFRGSGVEQEKRECAASGGLPPEFCRLSSDAAVRAGSAIATEHRIGAG